MNSSRLCRCAPASSPCPRPPPVTSWTERMSTDCWLPMCELCSWALGTGVQIKPLGVLSRLGLAMGSLTHLRPAALAGAPVEHRMWAKPRLPPLSPVEPSAMAAALPGRCCHGPISLLTETLGPGPAPSTATPVGTPQRPPQANTVLAPKGGRSTAGLPTEHRIHSCLRVPGDTLPASGTLTPSNRGQHHPRPTPNTSLYCGEQQSLARHPLPALGALADFV